MKTIPSDEAFKRKLRYENGDIVLPKVIKNDTPEKKEDEVAKALLKLADSLSGIKPDADMRQCVIELTRQTAAIAQMVAEQAKALRNVRQPAKYTKITISKRDEDGYAKEYMCERED